LTWPAIDVTPRIAKHAFELYEQQGRHEGHAVQDWLQAEREVSKKASSENSRPQNPTSALHRFAHGRAMILIVDGILFGESG